LGIRYVSPKRFEQLFNIGPRNIKAFRFLEYPFSPSAYLLISPILPTLTHVLKVFGEILASLYYCTHKAPAASW